MERTLRWLDRCRGEARGAGGRRKADGTADGDLTDPSAYRLTARPSGPSCRAAPTTTCGSGRSTAFSRAGAWTGVAIGGLSVGEPKPVMHRVLEELEPILPRDVPRYLMGVGFPADLLEGIARGVDLFDCVAATRNGRHGTAWLPTGG